MGRSTLSRRRRQHVIEALEERRLLSLAIDLRVDVGNAGNTDPGSIIDAHTIKNPQVGDVYQLEIWAQVHGADSDGSNDKLDLLYGSIIASELRTGGYFGAVQGSFAVPALEPAFDLASSEASAGAQYTDANGNVNVGSTTTDSSAPQNFFHPIEDPSKAAPPTNLLDQGSPGAGQEQELATTTFTVTSVVYGPPTTLLFNLRVQKPQWVSALWIEDGTGVKDTLDNDPVSASTGITVTEPDTIAPAASATLAPILGSTPSYQFTVNYSDNQDLNLSDFSSSNILVTGPNGYTQMASVVGSPVDANASANAQYDPYNVTYQITPPDSAWSIADNGAYTFTLEAGQIADNSGNFAPSQVLGGGPLNVRFTGAVSITPATASIGENSTSPFEFTVTRTDAIDDGFADAMTVGYTVGGSTVVASAVAGTNYTALSGTVTIPAGQATATIDVQPIDDQIVNGDSALTLTVNPGSTYVLGTPTGTTLTISNTDTTAASIADVEVGRNSSDQTTNFTVTLSEAALVDVYVDYSTSDITALAGTDYTATSGVLTFPAGTTSETIPVAVLGSNNRGDRSFNMNLTVDPRSTEQVTIANTPAVGTISDIVSATLSPLAVSIAPGLNITNAVFTVTLDTASTLPVTVNYATTDGSAAAGTDYTATSGTLTFAPGQTTQTIDVPISAIIRSDAGKSFTFGITAGTLTSVDPSVATATVTLQTPAFTELSINPKKGASYIDAAGNKVTVKVSGISASTFIGNILFPTGGPTTGVNAVGIVLDGTTAKSNLTIITKSTTMDFIDVNGSLKTVSAKGVSLTQSASVVTAPYFTTTGSTTTATLGALSNATITSSSVKTLKTGNVTGSTLNIAGNTPAKLTFGNIQDSSITDSASISKFSTTQWLNTDSVADLLSVAGLNSLTSKGNFQAAISAGIVGTVSIKGAWSNALMVVTSVKKMSVGTSSNSALYASVNPNTHFVPAASDLAAGGQIAAFTVTSKAANAFSATTIEAQYTGTLSLGSVTPDNNGDQFGVATESIKSITVVEPSGKTSLKNLDNSQPGTPIVATDFVTALVG